MNSNAPQAEKDVAQPVSAEPAVMEHWPIGEISLKRRLSERFSVPGALLVCHRRTIIGTWKACQTPFHIYNLGMGGVNFWNHGMDLKPGTKIKLTLLIPKARSIDVVGVVVWSKGMPASDAGDGSQRYSHVTGVKFVDYDAGAWAVLREIHQVVAAESPGQAPSKPARAQEQSARSPTSEIRETASPQSSHSEQLEASKGL